MNRLPYVWWCNLLTETDCAWRTVDFTGQAFVHGLRREPFNGYVKIARGDRRKSYTKENIEGLVLEILPMIGQGLRDSIEGPISLVPVPNRGMAVGAVGPFRCMELADLVAKGYGEGCTVVPALRWDKPREQTRQAHDNRDVERYEPHLRVVEAPAGPIVLFDDVLTSGFQMIAAARVLARAGHSPARGLVIAAATKAQLAGKLFGPREGHLELKARVFKTGHV